MPPSAILLIFLKAKKNKKSIKLKADSNYKAISKPTYGNTHIIEGKKKGISKPLPKKKKKTYLTAEDLRTEELGNDTTAK